MKIIVTIEMKPRSLKVQAKKFINNKNCKCKMKISDTCFNKQTLAKKQQTTNPKQGHEVKMCHFYNFEQLF